MNKYEAMFIIKPDLPEEEKNNLLIQIKEVITKRNGSITTDSIWGEKRKLYFVMKKYREAIYYLVNFSLDPSLVSEIKQAYNINDNILRYLITKP